MAVTDFNRMTPYLALPILIRAAGTVDGATIDRTSDGGQVLFVIVTAALTDGSQAIALFESDNGSAWTAVNATEQQGTVAVVATNDDSVFYLGYNGKKRYVRLQVVTLGGVGGVVGAVALVSGGRKPVVRA